MIRRIMGAMVVVNRLASQVGILVGHDMRPQITFVSVRKASPSSIGCSIFARVPKEELIRPACNGNLRHEPVVVDLEEGVLLVD